MNTVQYFSHSSGFRWVAVVAGRFIETVYYWQSISDGTARIETNATGIAEAGFYERIESGYSPCSYEAYKEARLLALASLLNFFADTPEFTTPSTRPLYVDRPNCHQMVNDLPF